MKVPKVLKVVKDPLYWNTDKPPLLMQGFTIQATSAPVPLLVEDRKVFETRVNRGVVTFIDYIAMTQSQFNNGNLEAEFQSTEITLVAGGQEILVNEPGERYNYQYDLGDRREHKIPVIINGGQSMTSTLKLPDLISSVGLSFFFAQLICHYSTRQHQEWVKQYSKFGHGLGLKRRSFRLFIPDGSPIDKYTLTGVIPKNQGKVIGFSFLTEHATPATALINFSIDNLGIIENVVSTRWSRFCQRDPYIMWIDLNPGSVFDLTVDQTSSATQEPSNIYVTFYFDN